MKLLSIKKLLWLLSLLLTSFTCRAFLKGIPDEILSGKEKHLKPLKDQGNNYVFTPNT